MTKPHRKRVSRKVKKGARKTRAARATRATRATHSRNTKVRIHSQRPENADPEKILHSLTDSSKDNRSHISNLILLNLSKKKKGTRSKNNYRYFSEGAKFN
jgi:hypothetical protein